MEIPGVEDNDEISIRIPRRTIRRRLLMLSIAFAGEGQHQDTGAKMIHNAPHIKFNRFKIDCKRWWSGELPWSSNICKKSDYFYSHIECDTIIMDDKSATRST